MSILLLLAMSLGGCGEDDNPISSGTVTLTIKNGLSSFTIYYVYVSPSQSSGWGNDLLGSHTLFPGEGIILELPKGTYDIKVVDEDDDRYFRWGLRLNRNYTWTVRLSDMS